jgi:quercetin dioxygenase-like cupin family protein
MNPIRLAALLVAAAAVTLAAQVPVNQEPRHKVTFENSQIRIYNVSVPPGDMSLDHRHDFDIATVAMSTGANTRQQISGQPWGEPRPPRSVGDPNITEYSGKPQSHRIENIGKTAYQLFAVENLRKSGWTTTKPAMGLATKMTNETRAFRVYDVRLAPKGTSQTSHLHAVPTIAVLVSGAVMSDGPDAQAKTLAPAPVGLKQLTQPGQWILVPAGDTHHIVRLGTGDARVVEIEIR